MSRTRCGDAKSLEIKVEGEAKTVSELSASLTKVAKGTAGITAKRNSSGLIKYERDEPIVFGLQVTAVRLDDGVPVLDEAADPGTDAGPPRGRPGRAGG
jgi:hypothetical protein